MWVYDTTNDFWQQVFPLNSIAKRYGYAFTSFTYSNNFYFAVVGGRSNSESDTLNDFYLFDIKSNAWSKLPSIEQCYGLGLTGAQLQYYNQKLYLFGGTSINGTVSQPFVGMCVFEFRNGLNGVWRPAGVVGEPCIEGGSAVYDGFLYKIFGIQGLDIKTNKNASLSFKQELELEPELAPDSNLTIYRIDLSSPLTTWSQVPVSGCETQSKLDSFGYVLINDSIYINGGLKLNKPLNSFLKLSLNNSLLQSDCELLISNSINPSIRNGASMVYISSSLVLFGGQDQGVVYNDVWLFDLQSLTWQEIVTSGNYPAARYRHGYGVSGNYMVIQGGVSVNEVVLQDFYMLDFANLYWSALVPADSSSLPPPSYSSCLVVDFPKIYSIGGVESLHVSLSIWEFDVSAGLYTRLYENKAGLGLQGHSCYLKSASGHKVLETWFGSTTLSDSPFDGSLRFNLSEWPLRPVLLENSNPLLPARSHFAFQPIGNDYLVVAGGERYLEDFLKDVWVINSNNFQGFRVRDLPRPVYLAANTFFNNTLKIFSGFSNNGFSYLAPSSEYFVEVELNELITKIPFLGVVCGVGLYLKEGLCELCPPGTFNNLTNATACFDCPAGTFNPDRGASHVSQCIPCPSGTFSLQKSQICINCSSEYTCRIGSSGKNRLGSKDIAELSDFRDKRKQPDLYEPNNIQDIIMILWLTAVGVIFVFSVIFWLDYRIRIFLSYYDVFRNMHFEIHSSDSGSVLEKELSLQPSKFGGYLTVVAVVLLFTLATNSLITYLMTNNTEEIIFVPVDSLIEDKDFDSETLHVTLMFSSYRGKCDSDCVNLTTSSHIHVKSLKSSENSPFCYFYLEAELMRIVESGDFMRFELTDPAAYTSDINVRLKTKSSVPGKNSVVTQYLSAPSKYIIRGKGTNSFSFSLLPAYYREEGVFSDNSHKGYVLSTPSKPEFGNLISSENYGLLYGLNIQIDLIRVEVGYTTYLYHKIGVFEFIFKFMNDFPGTIVLIGFFMWFVEFFVSYCAGKRSGRLRLVKKHIAAEMERRKGGGGEKVEEVKESLVVN